MKSLSRASPEPPCFWNSTGYNWVNDQVGPPCTSAVPLHLLGITTNLLISVQWYHRDWVKHQSRTLLGLSRLCTKMHVCWCRGLTQGRFSAALGHVWSPHVPKLVNESGCAKPLGIVSYLPPILRCNIYSPDTNVTLLLSFTDATSMLYIYSGLVNIHCSYTLFKVIVQRIQQRLWLPFLWHFELWMKPLLKDLFLCEVCSALGLTLKNWKYAIFWVGVGFSFPSKL